MKTKKKTSYQKLKDKNQELMSDIKTIVHEDTPFIKRTEVTMRYRIIFDFEDQVWFGSSSTKL